MCAEDNKNEEQIYYEAISKPPGERQAYLKEVCGDDAELSARVEALLKAHDEAGDFLQPRAIGASVTLDSSPAIEGPGTMIGHYELLELIGEGGMGLVYLAEQKEPVKRRVALKIIKPGMDSKHVIARFEAEKQALALLDHPNIAHVFDAGTTETGRPYFVMEYVKGLSIVKYCDDRKLNIEQRLRLFEQVCEGVHHAHQKGIIHRDIKPSNILVSVHGDRAIPKIIDFGIAKAITQPLTDKTFVTFAGQLLGTPEYMSPEQVDLATQDIDTRSDIYSLGVVLYELLAGVLPFEEDSFSRAGLAEIQQTIREFEPASPSIRLTNLGEKAKTIAASRGTQVLALARRLHRELEWIPLKAMRKDRCRRYRSASELADDIRNYLNGLPLIAGPETAVYRVQKFVRKHAGSVATVALVAVAIILGLVVSTAMYFRAEQAHQNEAVARDQAEQAKNAEKEQRKLAETKAEELRRTLYVNSIQLADAKHREGNARQVRSLLDSCPEDLRGWEWNRLNYVHDESLMTLHVGSLYRAVVSRDGRRVVTCGYDDKTIKVWDLQTGKELKTLHVPQKTIDVLAISPDGKHIASGSEDKTIKIWDAQTGTEVMTLRGHRGPVWALAFSPNGKDIASGGDDKAIKLWDAETGAEVATLKGHRDCIISLAFSRDGKHIISGGWDKTIKIWEAATATEVMTLRGHDGIVYGIEFSPDDKRIVSASHDKTIKVWDVETGGTVITIPGLDGPIRPVTVVFSPDGSLIASGSTDNIVRIWDAETGEELKTFRGHDWSLDCVAFSPDGEHIISASADDTVKVWNISTDRESTRICAHATLTRSIAFSPDGKQIASSSWDSTIKLWDAQTGEAIRTMRGHGLNPSGIAFSPDGKRIAVGEGDRRIVRVWDASTGAQLLTLRAHKGAVRCAAFSPDGKYIVSGSDDKTIKVWDAESGTELKTLQGHEDGVPSVVFSPDGKKLISGSWDKTVKVWDWTGRTESMTLKGHRAEVMSVAFSPDGKRIASASVDRTAKVWDAATGAELMTLQGHRDILWSVAFSPDGKRIVTGGIDGAAKLWDSTTGTELLTLQAERISDVAFSPDGKTIAVAVSGGDLLFWESTGPTASYEQRRNAESARRIVKKMYSKYGSYHDVISLLKGDKMLDSDVLRLAIQMANSRKWEDADNLKRESFEVVSLPDNNIDAYKSALEKAQRANALEPNDPAILDTLGAAHYRLGSYEDAIKTLTNADKIRTDTDEESDPGNIAFKAMTLHKMGRVDEAKAALEQLRELCKDEQFAEDMEVQALLSEAEKLIAGEK